MNRRKLDSFLGFCVVLLNSYGLGFQYDAETSRRLCLTQCTAVCFENQTAGCKGYCNFTSTKTNPDDNDLPSVPDVMTFQVGTDVFVSWNPSMSTTPVLYVLQMKQDNRPWTTVMSEVTNTTYQVDLPDICSKYQFRVMAINMLGSNGFSLPAKVSDIQPGPLYNVSYVGRGIYYYSMTGEFAGIVELDLPPGAQVSGIGPFGPLVYKGWDEADIGGFDFEDSPGMQCLSVYNIPKLEFQRLQAKNISSRLQQAIGVKVHGDAFGCVFDTRVRLVSKCGVKGLWTNLTVNLRDCQGLKSFPCSSIKIPFNPPGNVRNVSLRADLHYIQARLRINWSPPTDLGSSGFLDRYLMRWGKVRPPAFSLFNPEYLEDANTTLDRTRIEFEVWVPKENDTSYGFQIVPLGPFQQMSDEKWGLYQIFTIKLHMQGNDHTANHTGHSGFNNPDDVRIIQVPNSLNISVFWNYDMSSVSKRSFNDHYVMKYGEVNSMTSPFEFRQNSTYTKVISPIKTYRNHTIDLFENYEVYTTYVLNDDPVKLSFMEPGTIGIKIVGVALGDVEAPTEDDWDNATLYEFTLEEPIDGGKQENTPVNYIRSIGEVIGLAVLCAILGCSVILVTVICKVLQKRRKLSRLHRLILDDNSSSVNAYNILQKNPKELSRLSSLAPPVVPDAWEVPHSCVKVGRTLGQGAFGEVLKGRISRSILEHRNIKLPVDSSGGVHVSVAVKMLKEGAHFCHKEDFLREINLMKEIGYHDNIVSMLGCCTLQDPVCLIVEHLPNGDLLTYLRKIRHMLQAKKSEDGHYVNSSVELLNPADLVTFTRQIAVGMEFLSQKGFIHRDLAARNILVGRDKNVKIGDFGLTRFVYNDQVYVNRNGGKLPFKWMSVEAIFELTFSTASDVWSFGIVLFEIVTLGGTPYPTIDTRDLLRELKRGYRMERPENCSEQMYQIMRSCWRENPCDRPSFTKLRTILEDMLEADSGLDFFSYEIEGNNLYYQVNETENLTQQVTTNSGIEIDDIAEENDERVNERADFKAQSEQNSDSNEIVCIATIEADPYHLPLEISQSSKSNTDDAVDAEFTQPLCSKRDSEPTNDKNTCNESESDMKPETERTVHKEICGVHSLHNNSDSSESTVTSSNCGDQNAEEFDADESSFSSDASGRRHTDSSSNGDDDVFLADDEVEGHSRSPSNQSHGSGSKYNLQPYSRVLWNERLHYGRAHAPVQNATSVISEQNDSGVSTSSIHDGMVYSFSAENTLTMCPRPRVWSVGDPPTRGTCTETSSWSESDVQLFNTHV